MFAQILTTYAHRWAIECTFENCKQFLGLEDPANRVRQAVSRTAPMAFFLYSTRRRLVPNRRPSSDEVSGTTVVSP